MESRSSGLTGMAIGSGMPGMYCPETSEGDDVVSAYPASGQLPATFVRDHGDGALVIAADSSRRPARGNRLENPAGLSMGRAPSPLYFLACSTGV